MKKIITIFVFTLTLFTYLDAQNIQDKQDITASELEEWVSFLASDGMRGRANGSVEMKTAADWIRNKFRENNLQPIFPDGEFIQNYTITARQRTVNERNVIGILPGTDPELKGQYIVLSAHFDHVGIQRDATGDSICNGADDNAAGVCTLIGIARKIMKSGLKPGRTLLFAAVSGEEMGMRGSRYFVANSPVPVKSFCADINFEMTGHSELLGKNRYYMTGCSLSDLDDIISEYNKNTDFVLVDTVKEAAGLFFGSDNISFSTLSRTDKVFTGIPSGTFATSTMASYLHSPRDEASLFDYDNMAGLVNYFGDMILYLSDYKGEIKWTDPQFKKPE